MTVLKTQNYPALLLIKYNRGYIAVQNMLKDVADKGDYLELLTYKLKRCSKTKCKQCRQIKLKGTMTKWLVQITAQRDTR